MTLYCNKCKKKKGVVEQNQKESVLKGREKIQKKYPCGASFKSSASDSASNHPYRKTWLYLQD